MKSVLVTGGSGFIGKHFIHKIEKNYDVVNYDLVEGYDIRGIMPYHKFDCIVHFAALKGVTEGEYWPHEYINTNCWGTANLLSYYPDTRFINISSSSANHLKSIYGATKQFTETIVSFKSNTLNIRLYNVFGENQPLSSSAVLPSFMKCKLNSEPPTIYGDGLQKRDFTYVGDVVASIEDVMFSNQTGTVHFGYGTGMSVVDLMHLIFGENKQYIQKDLRPFEIQDSCSPDKMPKIIYGREDGLKRTIKHYENSLSRV